MIELLAQSAPPVEISMTWARAFVGGAFAGGLLAFRADLEAYLKRDPGTSWKWSNTFARVASGALTGALIAVGLLATPV